MLEYGTSFGKRQFLRLLVAGSFSMVVEYLLGLTDSIVAGNLIGESALAGVNLMQPVMTAVTFIANMIGVGMAVNYSRERGACDERRAHEYFTQGVITAAMFSVTIVVVLSLTGGAFMHYMSPGAEIASAASAYWGWYRFAGALEPLAVLLVFAVIADGDSRLCFISYAVQLAVNALISFFATRAMGSIAGSAIGTVAANACVILVLSSHFLGRSNTYSLVRHFSMKDTFSMMLSSFGDSCSFLCSAGLFFFLNKFVITVYGPDMLPVLATVIVTLGFLEVFNGIGTALSPVISVYVGERNVKAVSSMMGYANRWAVGEGIVLAVLLAVFPGLVAKMVGITDPDVVSCASSAVRAVSVGLVFYAIVGLYNSYYVFIDRPVLASMMTVLNGLVAPMALVWLFGEASASALWSSLAASPLAALAVFSIGLLIGHGAKVFPYLLDRSRADGIHMFSFELGPRDIVDASVAVGEFMKSHGIDEARAMRASLMTEEVLMAVRDHNGAKRVFGEVSVDLNDIPCLTLRDDGEIFDITDSDQHISSLRTYLVASVMESQRSRRHVITTGFNRNVFRFPAADA